MIGGSFLIVGLVAIGFLWIVAVSPLLRVDRIVVQGNETVPSDSITSLVEGAALAENHRTLLIKPILGLDNMITWPSRIPSSTLAWIPQLADLSVGKDYFFHTITITVDERDPFAIWCFMPKNGGDEACYWFDETGTLFSRAFDTQGNAILVVHDYSQSPESLNKKILPDEFVANLVSILRVVHEAHLNVQAISLNDLSLEEISVQTVNGPTIYFSLRFPADDYVQPIQNLMAQSNWKSIGYVDCRTENRIYYK